MSNSLWLFVTPWTVAYQVRLFMEFSRQGYWSGLPFPSPGKRSWDVPNLWNLNKRNLNLGSEWDGKPLKCFNPRSDRSDLCVKRDRLDCQVENTLGNKTCSRETCLKAARSTQWGFPGGAGSRESACQCRRCQSLWFNPWVGKMAWSKKWQPASILLPGRFHGRRS